jgi:hypothetical protein
MHVHNLFEELPGKGFYAPIMVEVCQAGEIGAVGEMLAKYGETPIGTIN